MAQRPMPPVPEPHDRRARLGAFLCALATGLVLTLVAKWLIELATRPDQFYTLSVTILIPLAMGAVHGGLRKERRVRTVVLETLLLTLLACMGATLFLAEGAVCLIMAFPLLWVSVIAGDCIGRELARRSRYAPVSLIPLVLGGMALDPHQGSLWTGSVTTTRMVRAPAVKVFANCVAFPPIDAPPGYWLCRIGLPYPVETRAQGSRIGARRECRFSGGIVLGEKIVALEPGRSVTFAITEQPDHPEMTHHATLERGRIEVRDNGDGTSALIGTSWYRLHIYPAPYFRFWADSVIHGVHERVFDQIARLSERREVVPH